MRILIIITMLVCSIPAVNAQEGSGSDSTIQCTLNPDGTSSCQ